MTLAAPRSRQGKFTLALVFLAVAVAAVGTFLWASQARADITSTTVAIASNQGATADPGSTITYTATITQVGVPGGTITSARFTVNVDSANLSGVTVTSDAGGPWQTGAECTYAAPTAACVDAAGPVASDTIVITGTVVPGGDGDVDPPTTCFVDDAGTGQANCTGTIAAVAINGASCSGGGEFLAGSDVTVDCNVPIGLTYCSDNDTQAARTFDPDPDTGDMNVALTGTASIVSGPTAGLTAATLADTASVTVTGAAGDSATVTLSTHLTTSDVGPGDCTVTEDVVVTFASLSALSDGHGALRHVDVDCGTERDFDAGNNHLAGTGDYDGNVLVCNGLLSNGDVSAGTNEVSGYALDDPDDAVGSLHAVCIIGTALTDADNADISWSITPTAAHQDPVDPNTNKLGIDVNGDDALEPCVAWRVGDVGVEQDITAIYTPTGETIYSNGIKVLPGNPNAGLCPATQPDNFEYDACQVLIKQWNSILSTKLVQDAGNRDGNDCSENSVDDATCSNANLSGETVNVDGVADVDGHVIASSRDYVDYVLGSHDDYYPGTGAPAPVDGAEQTYSQTGQCGTVVIEDPSTGTPITLDPDGDLTTLPTNSDKGVGITITPNDANGDPICFDGECTGVEIDTQESSSFDSNDPFTTETESITVCWNAGPGPEKQPLLAWVGQRIVLQHDWTDPATGDCPWYGIDDQPFYVRYLIQTPSPGALSNVPGDAPALVTGPDYIVVPVTIDDNCISSVIYESQNQGRVDVTAHVVEEPSLDPASDFNVISPEYDFWYYYMKFEDATLKLVPGARADHNDGLFSPQNPSAANDVASMTDVNVSQDVLLRVTVRGWVSADNCPVRDAGADINGLLLPANRCIFPDDWAQVVGSDDQFDILGAASGNCPGSNIAGPFSTLNGLPPQCYDDDSVAPHVDGGFRHSVFSNGSVGKEDAPMPPALITLTLSGSGFLKGADKADVYSSSNEYFNTHIPAEPQILTAGSGYQWHTWTGAGDRSGLYHNWTSLAGTSAPIVSCPGDSPCADGAATGGYGLIQIYSDNHGEAMAWVNGDANLTFDECDDNLAAHGIVLLSGHYCEEGDLVGSTTVTANADYPDKKPHRDIDANDPVTITWAWAGTKDIEVVDDPADATGQFNYVVFRVTDRDGFCSPTPSLHTVLGEDVHFEIDSPTGVIFDDVNGNASAFGDTPNGSKSADVTTFDADSFDGIADGGISLDPADDVCEAWIHVSESQLSNVNVIVTAYDPEGTVTFDTKEINPTPTPSPVPVTPTPFNISVKWGDTDCGGTVATRDSQALLKRILEQPALDVSQPCPSIGQQVIVNGTTQHWGDFDCSGALTTRDSQSILKNVLQQTALSQTEPCPDIGASVLIEPISIP